MKSILPTNPKIAIVSPSWSGPNVFPHVYQRGIQILQEVFNAEIIEMPMALHDKDTLYSNPEGRANDINRAFADDSIDMIIASIGGNDSIRILPYLDRELIRNNPKPFMGFSDSTSILMYLNSLGIVTFHGPSVMAGFAEPQGIPEEQKKHLRDFFFNEWDEYNYQDYSKWCEGHIDWMADDFESLTRHFNPNNGWNIVQGSGVHEGKMFGGSLEIFEMMKGTQFHPKADFWNDKILFLETSEEIPGINYVRYAIRSMGMAGVFDGLKALLWGRTTGYSQEEELKQAEVLRKVITEEFGRGDLPIITSLDFGHTNPQWVMPLGMKGVVNLDTKTLTIHKIL